MSQNFGRVLITSIYDKKENFSKIPVYTQEEYMKQLSKNAGGFCEFVGLDEFQVKPYFDLDPKGKDFDYSLFDEFKADVKKIYDNEIYEAGREARKEEWRGQEIIKHSRRFYLKARITYSNIPIVFKDIFDKYKGIIDDGVYNSNRRLYAPLSQRKRDLEVPQLKVIKGSLFDCCASYILEEYEDLDKRVGTIKEKSKAFMNKILEMDMKDDEDENDNDKYLKLKKLISKLKENRSANFDTWIKLNWSLINIGIKENINRKKIERLIHEFSKLSPSNYDEDKVDDWIVKNFDKVRDYGYCWNYLYQTCLKEDAPEYYEKLTKSYYNVKKDFEINHLKIVHPPFIIYVDENQDNIIQPIPLCEKSYRHIEVFVREQNKKGEDVYKKTRFIEKWLDDPKIRKYNKMVFRPPPLSVAPQEYNTWTDFEILKTSYTVYKNDFEVSLEEFHLFETEDIVDFFKNPNDKVIERFLEYINNLFNNIEIVNYILAYFANRLQNPAVRNNVCIILYGGEGDGKNRLFDTFKNIIGDKYFTELESGKQLFNTHSCIEKEKLFICVNEARGKDNYENADILKSRITTNTLMVNPKGIQEFQIDNYCDYIMTTNNHNAVNIQDKSRRFLLVETTSFYSRNSEFFNSFSEDIVENKKALRVIYEYLMKFDVKNVIPSGNFQNHIPITEIQQTIIRDNRDKLELFLRDLVNKDEFIDESEMDEKKLKNSALFAMWCNWIDTNKIKNEYNSVSFGTRLGILIKKKKIVEFIRKDTHSNTFIRIHKLKEFFDANP